MIEIGIKESDQMAGGKMRVLLTEDQASFASLISNMLSDSGKASFNVTWMMDLKSTLHALRGNQYDVLLLDLHLPDSLGLDTVRAVRKSNHDIPIVAMTGLNEAELARDALNAGAQDFFEKTELNAKLLARVINYAIERRAMELQLERHAIELEERVYARTQQLHSAKTQWEKTFDAVPDLIAIIDKNHLIVSANAAMTKLAGVAPGDLVGRPCYQIMHGANCPIADCPHAKLLQDGKEHVQEIYEPSFGLDLLVSTSPLLDEDGSLIGSVHVARDITLIKQAKQAVAESEMRHRIFMDSLPDPTVVYDNEGKVVYLNKAFERVFGWTMEEALDRRLDFVPREDLAETIEKVKWMMQGQPVVDFETRRLTKDGRKVNVLLNTAPLMGKGGRQNGNIVIMRDISAIRRAEAARRASEQKFQELVETMNEGLTMADPDGRIVYTNAKFCTMLGYRPGELTGRLFEELLDENSKAIFKDRWKSRQSGEESRYEVVLNKIDGESIFAIISPKVLRNNEGKMTSSFAIVTDITERKNLESQLLQAQKLEGIGQLAAGIAHEINTPTQYVLSNTGFLETSYADLLELVSAHRKYAAGLAERGLEKENADTLEEMARELDFEFLVDEIPKALAANRQGLERIAKIVLSIKEFAHPGQEEMQPADLNRAIENTITVARNEWKYVAEVETDLDPELPPVPCVIGEINQVILNLIVNAAQAISEVQGKEGGLKGRIGIVTKRLGEHVEISISDNGPGIPEKIKNRIFDPFFTTKEPGRGTGQGLAIAYRAIVNNHNGEIMVESREGEGTTFVIRLPTA